MENKRSINNKNVKQLLENNYLLIHCLTRWIDNRRRPLCENQKMCWDSQQILIKTGFPQDFKTQKLGDLRDFEEQIHCFWGYVFGKNEEISVKNEEISKNINNNSNWSWDCEVREKQQTQFIFHKMFWTRINQMLFAFIHYRAKTHETRAKFN